MTRQKWEIELRALMTGNFQQLVELYKKAVNMPVGTIPQVGILASHMIEAILNKEFPKQP